MAHQHNREKSTPRHEVIISTVSGHDMTFVSNMLQAHLHEKSPYHDLRFDVDGRYSGPNVTRYFDRRDDSRQEGIIIIVDGDRAGFALLGRGTLLDGTSRSRTSVFDREGGCPDTQVRILSIFPRYRKPEVAEAIMAALIAHREGTWEATYDTRDGFDQSLWETVSKHHKIFAHDIGDHKVVVELTSPSRR